MIVHERLKYRDTSLARQLLNKWYGPANLLKKALKDYPLYRPPYPGNPRELIETQALDNYDYFMGVRSERLGLILELLNRFDIHIDPTKPEREGLLALDTWAYQQWPNLYHKPLAGMGVPDFNQAPSLLAIRSLLFDVALLLGECYLRLSPEAQWYMDTSKASQIEQRASNFRMVVLLPPIPSKGSGWFNLLDIEKHVFYHYRMQGRSLDTIRVDQHVGKVLSEPVLAKLYDH